MSQILHNKTLWTATFTLIMLSGCIGEAEKEVPKTQQFGEMVASSIVDSGTIRTELRQASTQALLATLEIAPNGESSWRDGGTEHPLVVRAHAPSTDAKELMRTLTDPPARPNAMYVDGLPETITKANTFLYRIWSSQNDAPVSNGELAYGEIGYWCLPFCGDSYYGYEVDSGFNLYGYGFNSDGVYTWGGEHWSGHGFYCYTDSDSSNDILDKVAGVYYPYTCDVW